MDPVIASKFPSQAEAVLTCRMDPRVQGSSTGPWELGQRVAKLGYWWPRALRRNWARMVKLQMVGWRMIRDREGDMRELEVGMVEVVLLGQLVAGMEGDGGAVGSDGLQVVEEGGAVMEGKVGVESEEEGMGDVEWEGGEGQ